jgi:SAM-dependent methyltransferase
MNVPTLGQMLLGTEGLALLRLAFSDDSAGRNERVAEMRALLDRYHSDLTTPLAAREYDLAAGYQLWSATYDAPLRLFPLEEPPVRRLLGALPPGRILDAACGTGRHSAWLAARGHEVVGIDVSPDMLAKARAKIPDGRFELGEVTSLPLPDVSVDAVLCALALVHVAELSAAIAEFARVVRPGGSVIVSDVHPFLVKLGWQAQFHAADNVSGFMRLHSHLPSDYARAAVDAGLQIGALLESVLTPESAVTVAQAPIPAANLAAWVGLPGVIVWEFRKPPVT